MYNLIVVILLGTFWSQASFANSYDTVRTLADKPFLSQSDVDNFMNQLSPLTARVDLQDLPDLIEKVAQLNGDNQFGLFKAAAILWNTTAHYKSSEDVEPGDVKSWYQVFEVVEKSSISQGLLNVLGAIIYDGCSNSVSGWFQRTIGYVDVNHQFCQKYVIPKFLKYAKISTGADELAEIALNSRFMLSALLARGYECSEYSSVLQPLSGGLNNRLDIAMSNGYKIGRALGIARSTFSLTLSNMKWEIIINLRENR